MGVFFFATKVTGNDSIVSFVCSACSTFNYELIVIAAKNLFLLQKSLIVIASRWFFRQHQGYTFCWCCCCPWSYSFLPTPSGLLSRDSCICNCSKPFFSHKEYYNKVECVSIPLLLRNRTINNGKDEALNLAGGITRLYCWTPQGLANTHLLTPRNAIDTKFIARGKKYPRNKA